MNKCKAVLSNSECFVQGASEPYTTYTVIEYANEHSVPAAVFKFHIRYVLSPKA